MDGISDEFETWPDHIICVRVMCPWLLKQSIFDFIISITHSVLIRYPELADKMDMDGVLDETENFPDHFSYIPWFLKMPNFDLVISITPSVFIRSSGILHIRSGCNFGGQ